MKAAEREKAIELREQQWTYSEIAKHLKVSRGTLSLWLREVPYEPRQEVIARGHWARVRNGQVLRQRKAIRISLIRHSAKLEVPPLGRPEFHILGIMAYWTEGSKTKDSIVKFTNSDPDLILLMVRWLQGVCGVPNGKLRFHLRAHPGEDFARLERFWSDLTGIPKNQFYRTTLKKSESGGRTARKVRYGIASLIVCDTSLFYRIQGWIEAIKTDVMTFPREVTHLGKHVRSRP